MTSTADPGSASAPEGPHELVFDRYGKAETRVVAVDRRAPRHVLRDLTVSSALRGGFAGAYTAGDNSAVLPTDSQKNAVYGLAREHGIGEPEDFALLLGRHLLDAAAAATTAEVAVEEHPWQRIGDHDHAFARDGGLVRTARLVLRRDGGTLQGGLRDLVLLKSTGSEYHGFATDRFTTLPETTDRVLATSVTATWTCADGAVPLDGPSGWDHGALFAGVRDALVTAFADLHSLALQQTLHAMAAAVLDAHEQVESVSLVLPNRHHLLVDLSAFGMDNPGTVFNATDRPYGLIEGTVSRASARHRADG
ncbi:MAG: Uricase (urate oxidase) [uncultured Quadrisphaera sp.]|uniref:Uricase n=1 Tax=uncultured Quadrisphaera sp. TaxID=904978 RepID=A0A6J4PPH7_9ACTN|nr:MAG: Uricase (urate oxidase) [uncultured Quadrisphaera sp.]